MYTTILIMMCSQLLSASQLPDQITKCQFGDNECVKDSINKLLKMFQKGIPSLNIRSFDDFRPTDLQLWDSPRTGGTWIIFKLRNQVISGCSNATVTRVSGFEEDPTKSKIEIELRVPRLVHRSTYDMQLRWLTMVQTNTSAPCYAEFQNVKLTLNLKVIVRFQRDKRYLKIYELVPKMELGRFTIKLDDLYQ